MNIIGLEGEAVCGIKIQCDLKISKTQSRGSVVGIFAALNNTCCSLSLASLSLGFPAARYSYHSVDSPPVVLWFHGGFPKGSDPWLGSFFSCSSCSASWGQFLPHPSLENFWTSQQGVGWEAKAAIHFGVLGKRWNHFSFCPLHLGISCQTN